MDAEALQEFGQAWSIGSGAFRRECLEQMEGKVGENHPGQTRLETAAAKADRIVAEELKRRKWEEANLMPSAIEYTVAFGANDGRTPPVVVTRAVDLPVAAYALQALGQALSQNNTTNTVTTQEIDLAKPGSGGDSQ